ncbi:MAG: 6-carboxytetrahydropterin synthase [Pirellulaceae bacterium]|nr:6-carboxytetrahydropterin synthase [Pirellulaceae bacterium]MDP6554266.1 6-carboxytetrahydropterin synthase [Pirellulaceae bacterium]
MPEQYRVRLFKPNLVFSAAHFITFNGDVCERLHGHNYRVAATIHGELDENYYVIDFIALRDSLAAIVAELDHHMLLPTKHRTIHVQADEHEVEVTHEDRRWVFPRGDCILLPVENTTAELLARHIGGQLLDAITEKTGLCPAKLVVEVDENGGQWGVCEVTRPSL